MDCELCQIEQQRKTLPLIDFINKRSEAVSRASRDDLMAHGWLY